MDSIYLEYTISPRDYRAMSYFNAFSIRRGQSVLVTLAWLASGALLLGELLGLVELTRIMHLCFLVVSISLPILLFSLEYGVRNFREHHCGRNTVRRIAILTDEGVRHATATPGSNSNLDRWDSLLQVFETPTLFLLYKDARRASLLPKSAMTPRQVEDIRRLAAQKLGSRFRRR